MKAWILKAERVYAVRLTAQRAANYYHQARKNPTPLLEDSGPDPMI